MMNNYDENTYSKELLDKIKELENENAKLKVENQDLKNKVEVQELVDTDFSKPVSLNDYYLSKYLDTHDEIFKKRMKQILERSVFLKAEIAENECLLIDLNESTQDFSNLNIEEEVEKLEMEKELLDKQMDQKVIELTDLIKRINNMLMDAKKYAVEYYENLVRHLGKASFDATIEYMDFILSVVRNSFYDQNVLINDEMNKASNLNKELEDFDKQIEIEKKAIDEKIKSLSDTSIKDQIESIENTIKDLKVELEQNEKFKDELEELFKDIKQKHIKEICDQISYMQIRDVVNKEIANSLEELIEIDFASMLETIDTLTSAKLKKETEIKSLNLRKAQLEQVQNEYDEFVSDLGNIEGLVETINQNIKQIEEYALYALKAIESNKTYQRIYDEYTTLLTKKDVLVKEIENLEYELVSLKETRREKVLDPYARPIINELNENIAQRESKLDRAKTQIEKISKDIDNYAKTKEETVVVTVINEKVKCEQHLPDLYNKQRELLMIVEEKKNHLSELKAKLDEYDLLTDKLEALSNES